MNTCIGCAPDVLAVSGLVAFLAMQAPPGAVAFPQAPPEKLRQLCLVGVAQERSSRFPHGRSPGVKIPPSYWAAQIRKVATGVKPARLVKAASVREQNRSWPRTKSLLAASANKNVREARALPRRPRTKSLLAAKARRGAGILQKARICRSR